MFFPPSWSVWTHIGRMTRHIIDLPNSSELRPPIYQNNWFLKLKALESWKSRVRKRDSFGQRLTNGEREFKLHTSISILSSIHVFIYWKKRLSFIGSLVDSFQMCCDRPVRGIWRNLVWNHLQKVTSIDPHFISRYLCWRKEMYALIYIATIPSCPKQREGRAWRKTLLSIKHQETFIEFRSSHPGTPCTLDTVDYHLESHVAINFFGNMFKNHFVTK